MHPTRVDLLVDLAYGVLILVAVSIILVADQTTVGVVFVVGVLLSYIIHVVWKLTRGKSGESSAAAPESSGEQPSDESSQHTSPAYGQDTAVQSDARDRGSDTPEDSVFETVNKLLETGDDLRETARTHGEDGDYDRAMETYERARETYEEALDTATGHSFVDTDTIEERHSSVDSGQREIRRQQLQDEIESLRLKLDRAGELAADGDTERARTLLADLESKVASARESTAQHGFDGLREELQTLEQRRDGRLRTLTGRLERGPPAEVPRAPSLSVDYEALTDREHIGAGGNADVTRARLPTSDGDATLAVKEPRMSGTLQTETVERMMDEADTWQQLDDHDHIVSVVDYGIEPLPWIGMEYMDAGHLGERAGELPFGQALWTATATAQAVRYAHRRGVAHLDLKPENILFRGVENAWDVPKVADWGLSKHLLEHSKSVEGLSPHYAAPEQFDDSYGSADDITDVYQLGAVFYELFTGQPPFEGQPVRVMNRVINEEPTPPSDRADIPGALDDILLTALATEKDDRYESVLYLRDDLQELRESV